MPLLAEIGHGEGWFAALPDHDGALAVAERLPADARRLTHCSGRPWLVGMWADEDIVQADAADTRLALLGRVAATPDMLARWAERTRDVWRLDALAGTLVGSCHLLASVGGQVRAQGSLAGTRRVFHQRVGATTVAADRADLLAWLSGAAVDEARLALRLLCPAVPHPLAGLPTWRGVSSLAAGDWLHLTPDGAGQERRWWRPPEAEHDLAEGARLLRASLSDAVAARTAAGGVLSCDLSGGLDSSSVAGLAVRGPARVLAFTVSTGDPTDEDPCWADQVAATLPGLARVVAPPAGLPLPYDGVFDAGPATDEPDPAIEDRAGMTEPARRFAGRSRAHLTGHGGDEALCLPPSYLHTLVRSNPALGWDHLRGHRALRRWPLRDCLAGLADRRSYGQWLADGADLPRGRVPGADSGVGDWGLRFWLPPWVAVDVAAAVRDLVRAAARDAEPLAADRPQHDAIEAIRAAGRQFRLVAAAAARAGLPLEAPFLDDRVIEACLSTRIEHRGTPWRYKPLLAEAMRGVLPAAALGRTTTAEGSSVEAAGLRAHRAELVEAAGDSRLARLGLIDSAALRRVCQGPLPPSLPTVALALTFSAERWLRDCDRDPAGGWSAGPSDAAT